MNGSSTCAILVGFDPDDVTGTEMQSAALLAERTEAELHVLTSTAGRRNRGTHAPSVGTDGDVREVVEFRMEQLLGSRRKLVTTVVVTDDDIAEAIHARTAARGADTVVLGRHRHRGIWHAVAGSTADRVIRRSEIPCLLSNRELTWPIRRVLLPTDFSVPARRALEVGPEWVGRLSECAGETLDVYLIHVNAQSDPHPRLIDVERLLEVASERGAAIRPGQLRFHHRFLIADTAAEGIERAAAEIEPDLVVLGTHGYNWLGRALIGSVASEVARTLPHPVLLVPPKRSGRWWIPDEHA
jgi:nucleotide-binding universal stress UspA family protein